MRVTFLCLFTAMLISNALGDCCKRTVIHFSMKDPTHNCLDYPRTENVGDHGISGICSVEVCGDGEPPGAGVYCGYQSCNIFGCNCDGGCVPVVAFHLNAAVYGDCCRKVEIRYRKKNVTENCLNRQDAWLKLGGEKKVCAVSVCGNGKPPDSGIYCGVYSCNIFGCNCGGGCVPGHPAASFVNIYPDIEVLSLE